MGGFLLCWRLAYEQKASEVVSLRCFWLDEGTQGHLDGNVPALLELAPHPTLGVQQDNAFVHLAQGPVCTGGATGRQGPHVIGALRAHGSPAAHQAAPPRLG